MTRIHLFVFYCNHGLLFDGAVNFAIVSLLDGVSVAVSSGCGVKSFATYFHGSDLTFMEESDASCSEQKE